MFKSCNYCRHRKKKCILPSSLATQCYDCERLGIPCEFSPRNSSFKRQKTSQLVAARVSNSATTKPTWPAVGETSAPLQHGDTQIRVADSSSAADKIILMGNQSENATNAMAIADMYWQHVHPVTPFVPDEIICSDEIEQNRVLHYCIELASHLSLHDRRDIIVTSRINDDLMTMLGDEEMSVASAAGILLLILRMDLNEQIAHRTYSAIQSARALVLLPISILAGTLITHSWQSLINPSYEDLQIPPDVIDTYMAHLDETSFTYHFFRMSRLLIDFNLLRESWGTEPHGGDEAKSVWVRLEYECLMWPIKLPPSLLDLRDEMPATPEAVVLHCLQNLMFLSFYAYVFERQESLGNMLLLRPVPGVMHFLCSLARSTFVCPQHVIDRWSWIAHSQAGVVRVMLRLWRISKFENCKAILNLWDDRGRFPGLVASMREEIGYGPWAPELSDGYTVYWTFRDLRSMSLEFWLEQNQ
ncbi:hypothetical protein V490_00790 [Pseudogymnoascus sp. VKM F-3557]|nr:hypothetical protein V490_00790 [Pseudogymnoascus sp. VKM F-3557]